MITVDEVRARVAEIEASKDDNESAHTMEDELHVQVLEAIRDGAENPRELAAAAAATTTISFQRWYA